MNPVTLINAFEVAPGREHNFLVRWERIMNYLEQQKGFVSVALSQSPDPGSRFRFTAKTTFKTQEQLWSAIQHSSFQRLVCANDLPHYPQIFDLFLRPQARATA